MPTTVILEENVAQKRNVEKTLRHKPFAVLPTAKSQMGHYVIIKKLVINQRWSPREHPWSRGSPRGHILKSLALASKP